MAITFPLSLASFWDLMKFETYTEFELFQHSQRSETRGGDTITTLYGTPRWVADFVFVPQRHEDLAKIEALIKVLQGRDGTFLAYDVRRPYPKDDPTGSIIGSSTVTILSKGADNRSLALTGLPASYAIKAGDRMSITTTSSTVLVEAVEDVTASGLGVTAEFEVQPFLPAIVLAGQSVSLEKPVAKFKIGSGSYKRSAAQSATGISAGLGFSIVSVY